MSLADFSSVAARKQNIINSDFTPQSPDPSTCQGFSETAFVSRPLTDKTQNSIEQVPASDLCFPDRSQELPSGEEAFNPLKVVNSAKSANSVPASLSYVSYLTATLKIYSGITISKVKSGSIVKRSPGKRGKIGRFTKASRRNLIKKLAMLRDQTHGIFITLTYGSQFNFTPEECKIHLSILRKALTRKFPEHGAFWRLEVKERLSGFDQGKPVPHYHLLVYGVPAAQIEELRTSVHMIWTRAVYGQIAPFRLLRTEVREFKNQRHAMSYASKYAAKEEPLSVDQETGELIETSYQYGRRWGTWGNLDFSEVVTITCRASDLVEMRRTIAKWLKSKGSGYAKRMQKSSPLAGWTVFGMGDQCGSTGELWGSFALRVVLEI